MNSLADKTNTTDKSIKQKPNKKEDKNMRTHS